MQKALLVTIPAEKFRVADGPTVVAEASDLGFPVGQWPRIIAVDTIVGPVEYELLRVDEVGGHYLPRPHAGTSALRSIIIFND